MERTQIYLTEREHQRLRELSETSGKTQSELIRDAIDRVYLTEHSVDERLAFLHASHGAWKQERIIPSLRSGRRLKQAIQRLGASKK
jgi:Ribbon-helix-helix protein, copG family